MGDFQDKNVIVSGAGQGIGYGLCRGFAIEGANVVLNDIDADLARQAAAKINDEAGDERVAPFVADMADPDACISLVKFCSDRLGAPHIVVANAGITHYVPFLQCTPDVFDTIVAVNLRGSYFLAQAAARMMVDNRIAGRILLMSSVVGLRAFPNFSVYGMTKAALQMLARSLALELGAHGITVNAISPGATLTERTQEDDPNYAENWATVNISGRVGTVEDVVAAALFLASDAAGQITGHNLVVDGGWSLRSPLPEEHPVLPPEQDIS